MLTLSRDTYNILTLLGRPNNFEKRVKNLRSGLRSEIAGQFYVSEPVFRASSMSRHREKMRSNSGYDAHTLVRTVEFDTSSPMSYLIGLKTLVYWSGPILRKTL